MRISDIILKTDLQLWDSKWSKWSVIYHLYIANWMIICYWSHLLREPGNSIDISYNLLPTKGRVRIQPAVLMGHPRSCRSSRLWPLRIGRRCDVVFNFWTAWKFGGFQALEPRGETENFWMFLVGCFCWTIRWSYQNSWHFDEMLMWIR